MSAAGSERDVELRDPAYVAKLLPFLKLAMKGWFRSSVTGMDKVPDGGALMVSNHSGGLLAMDVPILAVAFADEFGVERPLHVLAHDMLFTGAADLASGARALVEAGAGCVAVTQGARGALVVTRDEVIEVPAYAVDVVDTTGCGDAFSAGFVLGRAQGRSLADSAALGCATAAQVAGGLGTDAGAYDLAAVEAFMAVTPTR